LAFTHDRKSLAQAQGLSKYNRPPSRIAPVTEHLRSALYGASPSVAVSTDHHCNMEASAPFVVRGEFVYHDTLFVDVGGALKRHARASTGELKTYLEGKAPKDQVAHWYEAQLIHYGLQRSKDKNTAKVRLQQALSQKKLAVPPHIVEMEAGMKKDYVASIKKSRSAASKAAKGGAEDHLVAKAPGKKRKKSDEITEATTATSKKTKITMKIGDVEVSIDHDSGDARSTGRKSKAVASSPATAASTAKGKAVRTLAPTRKPPATPQARKTTQNDLQTPSVSALKFSGTPGQSIGLPSKSAAPQKARVKTEPKVKSEPNTGRGTPSKSAPKVKSEVKPETAASESPNSRFITGVYNVSSPQLEEQYPGDANNFRFFLCVDNEAHKIWGGFELASKSGVLCITDDYTNIDVPLSFGWRARDSHRGGLSFGRGCFGHVQFFGDREFSATVFNMFPEPVELQGERRPGPLWCGKSAWQFEREWEGFVAEAYGR
jgi:hypothetical protein